MKKPIKKHLVALYVDTTPENTTPSWIRIKKSTELTVAMNPETEDYDYIADESKTTELESYNPTIEQPLKMIQGEDDFDYFWDFYYQMKVGEDAKTNVLLVYMFESETKGTKEYFVAWRAGCSIVVNELNAVDSELSFDINFAGTVEKGWATVTDGTPTYVKTLPTT